MPIEKKKIEAFKLDLRRMGMVLRQARENLHYTYRELAETCGVSASQLLRIESGEFEYSAAKLLKVCIALGIPAGALIEFATLRSLDFIAVGFDAEVKQFLEAKGEKHFPQRHSLFEAFVLDCNFVALSILIASSPVRLADKMQYPFPAMKPVYGMFATMVERFSNVERITMLRVLSKYSYEKLKSMQLVTFDQVKRCVSEKIAWNPSLPVEPSIQKTIQYLAVNEGHEMDGNKGKLNK